MNHKASASNRTITWKKYLKRRKAKGLNQQYMLHDIPHALWKNVRIKSIELEIPMKYVFFMLLEKWTKGEVEL